MDFQVRRTTQATPMDEPAPGPVTLVQQAAGTEAPAYDPWTLGERTPGDEPAAPAVPAWTRRAPTENLREAALMLWASPVLDKTGLHNPDSAGREQLVAAIAQLDPTGRQTAVAAAPFQANPSSSKPTMATLTDDMDGFWSPTAVREARSRADVFLREADGVGSLSTMVALYPPPHVAEALAVDGGEPVDQLHVTLAFLGDLHDDRLHVLVDAVRSAVRGQDLDGLNGEISGSGTFTGGEKPVHYASVDLPSLPDLRQAIVNRIDSRGLPLRKDHGFTPHMTLRYAGPAPKRIQATPVRFDHVRVVRGDVEIARVPIEPRDGGLIREAEQVFVGGGKSTATGVAAKQGRTKAPKKKPKTEAKKKDKNAGGTADTFKRRDPRSGRLVDVHRRGSKGAGDAPTPYVKPAKVLERSADGSYSYVGVDGKTYTGKVNARVAARWKELGVLGKGTHPTAMVGTWEQRKAARAKKRMKAAGKRGGRIERER